jgi:hypothetical protein
MAIIRHYLYLNWVQHYSPTSLVSVLDFRDTVFQSDPFKYLEKEIEEGSTTELWLSGEHMPYKVLVEGVELRRGPPLSFG